MLPSMLPNTKAMFSTGNAIKYRNSNELLQTYLSLRILFALHGLLEAYDNIENDVTNESIGALIRSIICFISKTWLIFLSCREEQMINQLKLVGAHSYASLKPT